MFREYLLLLTALLIVNFNVKINAEDFEIIRVDIDNYARVAFDKQALATIENARGINNWDINKQPVFVENQQTIHTNRDMLYLMSVIDIQNDAQILVPEVSDRYISFSIINRNGYTEKVFYGGGVHSLINAEIETDFVFVIGRIMVDADDVDDVEEANSIQNEIRIFSGSERNFPKLTYNTNSFDRLSSIFFELTPYISNTIGMFGDQASVHSLRFLIGTAVGWGNLPEQDAIFNLKKPDLPINTYELTMPQPSNQSAWSITIYNSDGYFQRGSNGKISINSLNAIANEDHSITIHFGGCDDGRRNCLRLMPNWTYAIRIYRPEDSLLSQPPTFPKIQKTKSSNFFSE